MKKRKNDPAAGMDSAKVAARRLFSQGNYPFDEIFPGRFEVVDPEAKSMTVPDQSYSVQELFERSRAGLTVPGREAIYSEEDIPPFERMNFAERIDFLNNIKEYRSVIEERYAAEDELRKQEEARLAVEATQKAEEELIQKIKKSSSSD